MKKRAEPLADYMTVNEAVEELGVTRKTVYNMIGRALLTPVKAGWSTLFRRDDVESLKQKRAQQAQDEE